MVIVKDLVIKIQDKIVIKSLSCSLIPGKITVFTGKSGAGKTTLLKSLVGLIPPTQGLISINDKEITNLSPETRAQEIGYVFQSFNLFPHFSVLQNCIDPLLVQGMPYDQAIQRAHELLELVEMQAYSDKYPSELSGGEQQRSAIARALCLNPRILLLDEPTASLDPENSANIAIVLQKLALKNIAIGVSSHDMIFVKKIFDRGYVMHEGIIIEAFE